MIVIEFNNNGYSIKGDKLESNFSCSPNNFWDPIDLLYIILIKALVEIKNHRDDIICYNDSRIIDEINGLVSPILDTSKALHKILTQEIIPANKGIIIFRKKPISIKFTSPIIPPVQIKKGPNSGLIEKLKKRWFKI